MAGTVRIELDEVLTHFEKLEDPRSYINQKHPLHSVILSALMATLAGAGGPTAIALWARTKEDWLRDLLPLPNGIPRKDVFRRVFMALDPLAFQLAFESWVEILKARSKSLADVDQPVLATDGKTLRRSHDKKNSRSALHLVSVWASELGLSLDQVATYEKSNEITAIPILLAQIDITGAIITIDAMGTQTAIAEQITQEKGDYVLALKKNHKTLHGKVEALFAGELQKPTEQRRCQTHLTEETAHGRIEVREVLQLPAASIPESDLWPGLKTVAVVMLTSAREGKQTSECRYFLSSHPIDVTRLAHAIRSHSAIENSCHWSPDVTYREDDSHIRTDRVRENFAWLNRFTLSLLKQHPSTRSIAMKRRTCGWSDEFLLQVLTHTAN